MIGKRLSQANVNNSKNDETPSARNAKVGKAKNYIVEKIQKKEIDKEFEEAFESTNRDNNLESEHSSYFLDKEDIDEYMKNEE